jgi:hypothetical protein
MPSGSAIFVFASPKRCAPQHRGLSDAVMLRYIQEQTIRSIRRPLEQPQHSYLGDVRIQISTRVGGSRTDSNFPVAFDAVIVVS